MSGTENKIVPFQSQRSISNQNTLQNQHSNNLENNQANAPNASNAVPKPSALKLFFTSKLGIIVSSVVGTVVVVAVVAAVVATQVLNKKDDKEETETHLEFTPEELYKHNYTNDDDEIFNDEDEQEQVSNNEEIGEFSSGINKEDLFVSSLSSLTKSNTIQYTIEEGAESTFVFFLISSLNASLPVAILYKIIPTDHKSTFSS